MRKLLLIVGAIFGLIVSQLSFLSVKAQASTQDFVIQSFEADYYLSRSDNKTSLLDVKETIVAEFPNFDQNHGILRAIPRSYQGHSVNLEIDSVTDQTGQAYAYSTSSENDNTVLKIGDANKYVRGVTTYNINYSLRNVINYQSTDEFYWDINGTEWAQLTALVVGRLHMSASLAKELTGDQSCITGAFGSKEKNCTTDTSTGEQEVTLTTTAASLSAFDNVTMVVGFKAGTFQQGPEVAAEKRTRIITIALAIGLTLVLPLITFIVCFRKWWQQGRDPEGKGVIIPEYVSPKHLNVLSSSYILDMSFSPKASSAGIIELAVKGYLRIIETEKKKFIGKTTDYEIEVAKDITGLSEEQRLVLDALFDGTIVVGSKTTISSQKNKLYSTITTVGDYLGGALTQTGYFSNDPKLARKRFTKGAVAMLIIGFVLFFLLPLGVGLVISALIAFIFSAVMPARTSKGVETRDYLLGLKEYIKMAEADRLKYLQSPKGAEKKTINPDDPRQQIKLFEDLLPYAMLFGLEKDWAEQFKDLYTQPPGWYSGNMNTFNAVYLANSLSSFSSANSVAFSAPSSSGSSGFGGGGFSGGGGGGGGGGGW